MVSNVFANDFNKASKHNNFFITVIAKRIAQYERNKHERKLEINKYSVILETEELKATYADVSQADKDGIDAAIQLKINNEVVHTVYCQLKSIFTTYRTVSVEVGDVAKLDNVKYYITIYDMPDEKHQYVICKAKLLKEFINEKQSKLVGTYGHFRKNEVHSKQSFYAIPLFVEGGRSPYKYFDLTIQANNIALFIEVPYEVVPDKEWKSLVDKFKAQALI